jgi:hypothetical protein
MAVSRHETAGIRDAHGVPSTTVHAMSLFDTAEGE